VSREYRLYLEDMQASCEKVLRYTQNLDQNEFLKDEKTFDAVLRNLEIIGEAAKHIPDGVRTHYHLSTATIYQQPGGTVADSGCGLRHKMDPQPLFRGKRDPQQRSFVVPPGDPVRSERHPVLRLADR
jgi:hypothetical protein